MVGVKNNWRCSGYSVRRIIAFHRFRCFNSEQRPYQSWHRGRILPLAGPAVIEYSLIAVISQRPILLAMLPIPGFIADFVFIH